MKTISIVLSFILAAAVSLSSSAQADGITAIQVLQNNQVTTSSQEDSPVTVKLLGTGGCKDLVLDWGI
jgi:hypothetical protein